MRKQEKLFLKNRVAFSGKFYAGKTFCSDILVEQGYKKTAFAVPLKTLAKRVREDGDCLSIIKNLFYDNPDLILKATISIIEARNIPIVDSKDRLILQKLGQDLRGLDQEVWIKALINSLDEEPIVVEDVRYKTELKVLRDNDFFTIRINTPEEVRRERAKTLGHDWDEDRSNHISEIELDQCTICFDMILDGTLSREETYKILKERVIGNG